MLIVREIPYFTLFLSSKFLSKKYSRKMIFTLMSLNKNNFTSRLWWELIEEIVPRSEQMADEKEKACVRGYHVYEGMWAAAIGEVLVCRRKI